ncbi:DUF5658 family protein [Patescibacteria group bacterium]
MYAYYIRLLFVVCLVDLCWTLWGIELGFMEEDNPFLKHFLDGYGKIAFISVKLFYSAATIFIIERLAPRCSRINLYCKLALIGYMILFLYPLTEYFFEF